jgi:hypothetical protein
VGNTNYYTIPYPEQHDIPDGAGQMKAIADQVEKILHDGFTIPNGSFKVGGDLDGGDTATRYLALARKTGVDTFEWRVAWYNNDIILQAYKNNAPDTARSSFVLGSNGTITAYTYTPITVGRPVPFATEVGVISYPGTLAANTGFSVAVTFTGGRFTQIPQLICSGQSNAYVYGAAAPANLTGTTIRGYNPTTGTPTGITVAWMAIQMTPTSSTGFSAMAEETVGEGQKRVTLTCHAEDCVNVDIPITLVTDEDATGQCGPCGQPIEDITTE